MLLLLYYYPSHFLYSSAVSFTYTDIATFSGSILNFSGIKSLSNGAGYLKTAVQIHKCDTTGISKSHRANASASRRIQNLQKMSLDFRAAPTPNLCAGRNYELHNNDDYHREPFWLSTVQKVTWAAWSLFQFLAEQPSQLRYIKWPSFQSTVLTLVLVALLIVALSTVDSALSYLLALFFRRKA